MKKLTYAAISIGFLLLVQSPVGSAVASTIGVANFGFGKIVEISDGNSKTEIGTGNEIYAGPNCAAQNKSPCRHRIVNGQLTWDCC